MNTSSPRRPAALLCVLLASVLTLSTTVHAASPWSTQILSGARVLLNCPTLISVDAARALLADRERALAFAEETLGGQLFRRLIITIEPTLLTSSGLSEPTEGGGAVTFRIPVFTLERFETDGTSPFEFAGCHEEVHALANHLWEANEFGTLSTLGEGVAVYVEELRRGAELHWAIAGALQKAGFLYDIDLLLGGCPLNEEAALAQLNVYYAGATFVEFLLETYGLDPFSELYSVEWFRSDWQAPDAGLIEADPAEEIDRIYGRPIAEIDTAWRASIASRWDGSAAEAELFVRAYTSDVRILDEPVRELEEYWASYAYRLVGSSSPAARLYEEIVHAVFDLVYLRGDVLEAAYSDCRARIDRLHEMLAAWLDAIHAFELAEDIARSDAELAEIIPLLETARAGYTLAGDTFMAVKAAEWLEELGTPGN